MISNGCRIVVRHDKKIKEVIYMGSSDFRTHEKKKIKKSILEKKAQNQTGTAPWQLPQVEIIKKGKKEW